MAIKNYHRSVSFPIPSFTVVPRMNGKGSTSLPCRFSPFISQLHDDIQSLNAWRRDPRSHFDPPSRICEALASLDRLHCSLLEDLLQHRKAREALARRSASADNLLEDFLHLAGAYSSFRSAIVVLKQEQSATQAAIRRSDASRIASRLRSQKKAEKELAKIASALRSTTTTTTTAKAGKLSPVSYTAEAELEEILREVVTVTSEISSAVLGGIVRLSSASYSPVGAQAHCEVVPMLRKLSSFSNKKDPTSKKEEGEEEKWNSALERLGTLEDFLVQVEAGCERLLRRLFNTRVFLLNVLTPSL
ncbi:uncharacterized protein M6B38_370265 [Iris pallida]|uniref:Uncharacterized protein n=1 Tax=Iris pallida TaxID=29817 RepID=A0AAX6GEF1_IRIPA|nr:uncharacterized protein M6B38_370265 [Iris pallida]